VQTVSGLLQHRAESLPDGLHLDAAPRLRLRLCIVLIPRALPALLAVAAACTPTPKPSAPPGEGGEPPAPIPSASAAAAGSGDIADASPPPDSEVLVSVPLGCRATADKPLDLAAALANEACRVDLGDAGTIAPLPAAVKVRVEPDALSVASGHYLVFHVVLENGGTAGAEVVLEQQRDWTAEIENADWGSLGHLGHGAGTGRKPSKREPAGPPPPPPPKEKSTPGFTVSDAYDAKNRRTAMPTGSFGMIGLLGSGPRRPEAIHIVLAGSARATATVVWAARGYDPDKNYVPKGASTEGFVVPPPAPLAPGKYRLALTVPVPLAADRELTAPVTVTR
jgi:hypothetical protein